MLSLINIYAVWLIVMNGRQRNTTNAQIGGKKNDSNYDGNCTARHWLSGTYKISHRWIFVRLSVQATKHMRTLHFKCLQRWKSLAAMFEVTHILKVFSNHGCWNPQLVPKFQVMNFLHITPLTPRFLKCTEGFWKICWPRP